VSNAAGAAPRIGGTYRRQRPLTMCGRFTLTATPEALVKLFPSLFGEGLELAPSYNVAPSQNVLAVLLHPGTKEPEAVQLKWGLVPSWADDLKIGYRMINARLDSAPTKPAFRSAFKHRHCLILADGFYEWQKTGGKIKQPYHIRPRDGGPFAFAGLWETWHREGEPVPFRGRGTARQGGAFSHRRVRGPRR
jgi:putative SOS response-associated peptidase YedK